MSGERPNILFISTDQHHRSAISARGCRWVDTPAIDELCANGVFFTRSYSTDPVCAPARSSWWTGRFTSETGSVFNGAPVHADVSDLGRVLNANGYNAYHCGKWHVDGRDAAGGFRNLYDGRRPIGACAGEIYDPATTHAAVDLLAHYREDRPFFLAVDYVNPHDIIEYQHDHEEKDVPSLITQGVVHELELPPMPANFAFDPREPAVVRALRREPDAKILAAIYRAFRSASDLQWRCYLWTYYRFVEKVDREIGLLLRALKASRFRDTTLVVFTSDHGEALGSHKLMQKMTLYDESVRVPMIAACLGDGIDVAKGTESGRLVSGVDLLPSICDYTGAPVPTGARGSSLREQVRGGTPRRWRDFVFAESNYWGRMIATEGHKYITEYIPLAEEDFVPPGPDPQRLGIEQLFDLQADPGETVNAADEPRNAGIRDQLRQALLKQEATLERRRLDSPFTRGVIREWSGYIRARVYP